MIHLDIHLLTCPRALKIGGVEVTREKWDEADMDSMDPDDPILLSSDRLMLRSILPDWTRTPLPVGAPPAVRPHPPSIVTESASAQTIVGA